MQKQKLKQPFKKDFKKHIDKLCLYFRREFLLGEYKLRIEYQDVIAFGRDNSTVYACISVDDVYLDMKVKVSLATQELWDNKKYYELADVICHEFCHGLTLPLANAFDDYVCKANEKFFEAIMERQTQRIANALLPHIPSKIYLPIDKNKKTKSKGKKKNAKDSTRGK